MEPIAWPKHTLGSGLGGLWAAITENPCLAGRSGYQGGSIANHEAAVSYLLNYAEPSRH
jgi:hypothetical protein